VNVLVMALLALAKHTAVATFHCISVTVVVAVSVDRRKSAEGIVSAGVAVLVRFVFLAAVTCQATLPLAVTETVLVPMLPGSTLTAIEPGTVSSSFWLTVTVGVNGELALTTQAPSAIVKAKIPTRDAPAKSPRL